MAPEYADHALTTRGWDSREQRRVRDAKETISDNENAEADMQNVRWTVRGNNPMVGMTVAVAVAVSQALAK